MGAKNNDWGGNLQLETVSCGPKKTTKVRGKGPVKVEKTTSGREETKRRLLWKNSGQGDLGN